MDKWIHIIDSKAHYEKIWNYIVNNDNFFLGSFIIIKGSLKCKDGRILGKDDEIIAAITTGTFTKDAIEKMFKAGISDSSKTILIADLAPEELKITEKGAKIIKKVIKGFEKPSNFKEYLRNTGFEI